MQPSSIHDHAKLACRVLAVYWLIHGLSRMSYLLPWLPVEGEPWRPALPSLACFLIETLAVIAAGAFLWREADRVAEWMTRPSSPATRPAESVEVGPEVLHAIAFSTLGLWILVTLIPQVLGFFSNSLVLGLTEFRFWRGSHELDVLVNGLGILMRAAIGVYLLFGGAGLAEFARRSRTLARSHPQHPTPQAEARRGP